MFRSINALVVFSLAFALAACSDDEPKQGASASRYEAVRAPAAAAPSGANFCEKTYPASGPGARTYAAPPLRDLPAGAKNVPAEAGGGWTWVNLWATWCTPSREEMGLLGRWKDALAREGAPFRLELLSADAPDGGAALSQAIGRGLPGHVSWIRGEADFGAYLASLGVGRDAALPIHALVDPKGNLRCVRVGAIHDRDYPIVKALLSAP
jgi:thiol-disulfide isomerase/thioredoxin